MEQTTSSVQLKGQNSTIDLDSFVGQLDSHESPLSLSDIQQLLRMLSISDDELDELMQFDQQCYQRNLVARNDNYEALLLCFEAGQRTPIHDHAGSACGVKVISGTGTETKFEKTDDNWLYATGSVNLPQDGVVGSVDMDIHQLSNLQANGQRLVTLHVYSPPLGEVGNYSILDNSVTLVNAPTRCCAPRKKPK